MKSVEKRSEASKLPPLSMPRNATHHYVDVTSTANKENRYNTKNNSNNSESMSANGLLNNVRSVSLPIQHSKTFDSSSNNTTNRMHQEQDATLKNVSTSLANYTSHHVPNESSKSNMVKQNSNHINSIKMNGFANHINRAQSEMQHNNKQPKSSNSNSSRHMNGFTNGTAQHSTITTINSNNNNNNDEDSNDEEILREMEAMFLAQTKRLNKMTSTSSPTEYGDNNERYDKSDINLEPNAKNLEAWDNDKDITELAKNSKQVVKGAIYFKSSDKPSSIISNNNVGVIKNESSSTNKNKIKTTSFVDALRESTSVMNRSDNDNIDESSTSPSPSPEQPQVNVLRHFDISNNNDNNEENKENNAVLTQSEVELQQLTSELENREARIEERTNELRKQWNSNSLTSHQQEQQEVASNGKAHQNNNNSVLRSIRPASPQVFHATTDAEVERRALAAEDFAKNVLSKKHKNKWRHKHIPLDALTITEPTLHSEQHNARSLDAVEELNELRDYLLHFGDDNESNDDDDDDDDDNEENNKSKSSISRSNLPSPSRSVRSHKSNHDGKRVGSALGNRSTSQLSLSPSPRALSAERMRDATLSSTHLISSSSMTKLSDGAAAIIEMLARRPELILPAPTETNVIRSGDVLSPQHILKVDLQDALRGRHGSTGIISGAPYFRMVPKLNIAGVAQANQSAIKTIVNELRRAHIYGCIIWVNLREEPLVYINNAAHIVRERNDPLKPMIIPNVTGRVIESIESKLKQEVLEEASENGGNISVYVEGKDGLMEDQWESVDHKSVYTLAEVFHALQKQNKSYYSGGGGGGGYYGGNNDNTKSVNSYSSYSYSSSSSSSSSALRVRYFRRPITQNLGPQPADFDFVLNLCLEEPKAVFVFNCQTGRGRTSAMMQVANIVRFYQLCVKDIGVDVRLLRGNANTIPYRTIQKLVSLIPDGKLHERRLMIIMDMSDKVYSMSDHLNEAFASSDSEPEIAVMFLQMYAFFLVFSYYCEQRLWNLALKMSFVQWLNANSDIRLLIESIRGNVEEQLKSENVTAAFSAIGEESGKESEIARVIKQRHGNVLSSGRILCSAPMKPSALEKSRDNEKETEVEVEKDLKQKDEKQETELNPTYLLRQLAADVPIFTCGRLDKDGRDSLIANIRSAFPDLHKIYWLSLRAEAMVIINDVSYTLGDYYSNTSNNNSDGDGGDNANTEWGTTMHISLAAIEQMEDRLRRDVLLEAQENKGYIILHHRNARNERETRKVKVRSVRTPRSTMDDFVAESGICYQRVPIPFSGQMLASDLDPLLKYLYESNMDANDGLVINDSEGFTRTTVALNLVTLHRAARSAELRSIVSPEDLIATLRIDHTDKLLPEAYLASNIPVRVEDVPMHDQVIEVQLASTICQMLTSGSLLRTVEAAITLGGRGRRWNILHALDYLKRQIAQAGANKTPFITEALHGLRSYLLVLLSSLYMDDQGVYQCLQPFSEWVNERAGVANIINNLDARGEAALKYVSTDNLMKADLSRRCGDVLTANFALKADHFPGCQKKGLRPEICGAPNFRKVNLVNVYGVAIPTIMGIHNVLALLGASNESMRTYPGMHNDRELYMGFAAPRLFDPSFHPEELQRPLRGSVVWVNLREEPILYVGDRPFVFRDLAAPYVNVELTGIQTDKIEQVEEQLKIDVLNEADNYGGKFLVHDEGNPGELVGAWEVANDNTVKTLREVYGELEAQGFRARMLRLPVTDEQSPEINDFDLLVNALLPRIAEHLDRRETLSFVFNCQMGRGRTTTGMVICCLLIGLVMPEYYDELHAQYGNLYSENESDWSKGEYVVITQLKRVLSDGRQAKLKVDLVLEACSRMQNLRTAIESFVLSAASPDNTEEARARAHHSGLHYLIRYFNLIVFAVYLEEEFDRINKRLRRRLVQWMSTHPELTTLSGNCTLKEN